MPRKFPFSPRKKSDPPHKLILDHFTPQIFLFAPQIIEISQFIPQFSNISSFNPQIYFQIFVIVLQRSSCMNCCNQTLLKSFNNLMILWTKFIINLIRWCCITRRVPTIAKFQIFQSIDAHYKDHHMYEALQHYFTQVFW